MVRSPGDRRRQPLTLFGLAIYALFLVSAPFEHHDLACELKTPQHCTACTSTQLGADPYMPALVGAWNLADAGRATAFQPTVAGILLPVRSTGRSPPNHI